MFKKKRSQIIIKIVNWLRFWFDIILTNANNMGFVSLLFLFCHQQETVADRIRRIVAMEKTHHVVLDVYMSLAAHGPELTKQCGEVSLGFEQHVCYEKEFIQNSQNTFWSEHEGKKWPSGLISQPPTEAS